MSYYIGIDMGASHVKAVAVTGAGELLGKKEFVFNQSVPRDWHKKVRLAVTVLEGVHGGRAKALGVAAPGVAARDGRSIACMPGRLEGLEGFDWTAHLEREQAVTVLNDGHAALLGEVWRGAARGVRNVIMLTLGTGVGGAAMVEGRVLRGHHGKAGHFGHTSLDADGQLDTSGSPGSLELAIGNCSMKRRSGGRFLDTNSLVEAHRVGDTAASEVWLNSIKRLAAAIVSFTNVLDPEVVVIGGGIARAGDDLFRPLENFLRPMEWDVGGEPVKLVRAELGEYAGAWGVAHHAMEGANKQARG
jgi:glucokinase